MHPPWSMIFFTTLAGAAQGLMIVLVGIDIGASLGLLTPAPATSLPISGHCFTSALETKCASGITAWMAAMSSHETWFETTSLAPGRGAPCACSVMPISRSSLADHHWMRA